MSEFTVGDRVRSFHGYIGKVSRVFDDFSAVRFDRFENEAQADRWADEQKKPLSRENKAEPWYSVLVEPRGALLSPGSQLTLVEARR